jgi:hypothetical protein
VLPPFPELLGGDIEQGRQIELIEQQPDRTAGGSLPRVASV